MGEEAVGIDGVDVVVLEAPTRNATLPPASSTANRHDAASRTIRLPLIPLLGLSWARILRGDGRDRWPGRGKS
jgi:hypothetical protein